MAEKKITKRDVLNHIIATYGNDKMVVEYAQHEIELLDRKNSSKSVSKTATENIELANTLFNVLGDTDRPLTISEILALPEIAIIRVYNEETKENDKPLSTSKVSYILNNDNRFVRTENKKKAYFSVK
jgi:hypothetical protein